MKVGIIFGGVSSENDISVKSCKRVYENIDKKNNEVDLIYIDKKGVFYKINNLDTKEKKEIKNIIDYLKKTDIVFPLLHGKNGEDGAIQGFLEILNIKYIGCKILTSSICMDKVTTKILMEKAGFNQAKYEWIKYIDNKIIYVDQKLNEIEMSFENLELILNNNISYPMFVKPSSSGSSIGISRVTNKKELTDAIKLASQEDEKIIFEEEIIGREIECGILKDKNLITSSLGEVLIYNKFYDYNEKYNNDKVKINIIKEEKLINKINRLAVKAFNVVGASQLSRIDFFVKGEKIYINEINTMPGFTEKSMYPILFKDKGFKIEDILNTLIKKTN